jgi:hypothetical protein
VRRRRSSRTIPALLFAIIFFGLSELPLFQYPDSLLVAELPVPIAVVVAELARYRLKHDFWPWDRKRRKIERWRWLVESPAGDNA